MLLCLSLWLDMRGKPCGSDLPALLELYGGVRKRFDKAGLPAPQGAAVTGVLHDQSDLEDDDGEDGGLSLLELDRDGGVWLDGERAGLSLAASGADRSALNAAALEAVRRPEESLVLLGTEKAVLPLFDFALAQVKHCRGISGSETALLAEVRSAAGLRALCQAEAEDEAVRLGAVLKPDEELWFEALQG
tara:strand:- start:1289 stop:1858 length:570 start_codon:yes stop_codon:yes gene_type:complete